MAEQKQFSNYEETQHYLLMAEDEPRAVFVDTSLGTHLAVAASPFLTVSHLQQQISLEHFNCFPKFGRIIIKSLSVEFKGTDYHLPETMLLKTAFHGSMKAWIVCAEVWTPVGSLDYQKHGAKHVKSSQNHHKLEHTKPSPKHGHDHKHVSSQLHETPKTSSKEKKKNKERKDVKKIDFDINEQPTVISKPKKNAKTKNDVLKTGSQDQKTVLQKDHSGFNAKEELDEKTRNCSQLAVSRNGEESGTKCLHRPCPVHHATSVVQPSVLLKEDGGDNVVKSLQGTSIDLAENFKKQSGSPGPRPRKIKKKKSNAVTSANGPAFLEKGDAPFDKIEQKGIEAAAEEAPSLLNNGQEPSSQQIPLNLEKEVEEDLPSMKPNNTHKKRKACESERESQKSAQELSPSHLNNVPGLLAQGESLSLVEKEKEKEIVEDVVPLKLENTAKKRKTNKTKSSNTDQEFSSRKPNGNAKKDVTGHIGVELSLPDDVGRPEECVETVSTKNTRNRKAVPEEDHPVSYVKELPDEEIKKMASTVTAIGSDKPTKKSQKKQLVLAENLLSIPGNQHSNETMMEMDAKKNVDDSLTKIDADDALLKSENTVVIQKTNDNDRDCRKAADVASPSLVNDVAKVMSEDEPLNLIENEKEIKEGVAHLKSDNTAKKRKTIKAKNSGTENKDSSSRRQSKDETDGTSLTQVKHSLPQDVGRPEGSVETVNRNLKRSRNRKAVPEKDHSGSPVQAQPDGETREEDVPISLIQSEKPKKRTQKKQPVPGLDLSSLSVDQQLDEKTLKMDAPERVEQADDLLTNSYNIDSKNQKKVVQGEEHQDKMSETVPPEAPSGLADMRLPDKPWASKQRSKKFDQLTSSETSSDGHNVVESKKNSKTSEHQKSVSNQRDLDGVSPGSVEDGSKVSGEKFMDVPKSVDDSLTDNKSNDVQYEKAVRQDEEHGKFSQAPGVEVSAVLDEVKQLEKPRASKQKVKKGDQPSSVDTLSNGHKLVNNRSPRTLELQKSVTDQKHNTYTSPLRTEHSTVSKNLMDTLVSPADFINTSKKTGVSNASLDNRSQSSEVSSMSDGSTVRKLHQGKKAKKSSDKLEEDGAGLRRSSRLTRSEVLNASEPKKGLASSGAIFDDGSSSSSDDGDGTDVSNSSTTLPPADSDDESKDVNSKHDSSKYNGNNKANSGMKLESILRSSSGYKKAKLVASQSQGESEPPEFVPDSQVDI